MESAIKEKQSIENSGQNTNGDGMANSGVENVKEGEEEEVMVEGDEPVTVKDPEWSVPDGGWGWMVVAGATLTHFILVGVARCLGVIYLLLRERFNSSATETTIVAAAFNTMRSITAPLWGMACDRFGCRVVTIVGGLLLSLGFIISSFGNSLFFLIFSLGVVAGTGGAMVFTPAYIMVNQYFDKKKGRAMAFATVGSGMGQVILAPGINALSNFYGLFGTLLILGALELNNLVSGALYRPLKQKKLLHEMDTIKGEKDKDRQSDRSNSQDFSKVNSPAKKNSWRGFNCCCPFKEKFVEPCFSSSSLWRNSTFLVYCLMISTMQACLVIFLIFVPAYAKDELRVDTSQAALLVSIFGFADIGGRFIFAFLFDLKKFRQRRRIFYSLISIASGLMVVVTASMPSYIACAAMAVVAGIFEGGCHSQRATILSEFTTKQQAATAVGFLIFSQGLGNMYGPPMAGYFRDTTGTNVTALLFAGISYATAASLFFLKNLFSAGKIPCCNCRKSNPAITSTSSATI